MADVRRFILFYKIISAKTIEELVKYVSDTAGKNCELVGGPFFGRNEYHQAMVCEADIETKINKE